MARNSKITVNIIGALLLIWMSSGSASADLYQFKTTQQQQDFTYLTQNLRCLVCSNQTLADSNAPLAADLRNEIYQQVVAGHNRTDVLEYVVTRYGTYVLYKPPLIESTYLLWFGPFVALILAIVLVLIFIKRQRRSTLPLTLEQQAALRKLLREEQ
jgi:cytochrome c-type biogenesis protein CcmH